MRKLYLLNASTDPTIPGDLEIYWNLDRLTADAEGIDVRNNEYFAFVSDGHKIELFADSDYAPTTQAEIEGKPTHQKEVAILLKRFLLYCAEDGRFGVDRKAVEEAQHLSQLNELIPDMLIS